MNVPLSIMNVTTSAFGTPEEKLLIFSNSKGYVINPEDWPIKWYQKSRRGKLKTPIGGSPITMEDIEIYTKSEFNKKKNKSPVGYYHKLFIDNREKIKQYANTNDLTFMEYDIEVATKGDKSFPVAALIPVLCIGYYDPNTGDYKKLDDFKGSWKGKEDLNILKEFIKIVGETDPDIMVGYNSWQFDLPYIAHRAKICNIDLRPLSRIYTYAKENKIDNLHITDAELLTDKIIDDLLPNDLKTNDRSNYMSTYFAEKVMEEEGNVSSKSEDGIKNVYDLGGRLHYDILLVDVFRDQTLSGIKNRKMKTLADHYELSTDIVEMNQDQISNLINIWNDPVEKKYFADETRDRILGKDYVLYYLNSDVFITKGLRNFYFGISQAIADMLYVPLSHSIGRSNGMPSTLLILENLEEHNMVSIDSNIDRYAEAYKRFPKYRGANVSINKNHTGKKINDIKKYDFLSMYPSSMITWNLGPDSVKLISADLAIPLDKIRYYKDIPWKEYGINVPNVEDEPPFDWMKHGGIPLPLWEKLSDKYNLDIYFELDEDGTAMYIEMPDQSMNTRFKIRIDLTKDSFNKQSILGLMKERKELKGKMKAATDRTEVARYNAEQNARKVIINSLYGVYGNQHGVGHLPTAVAVTALCRYTINQVVNHVGDDLIELDTDGVIIKGDYTLDDLNTVVKDAVLSTGVPVDNNYMELEEESFKCGYFYKSKNYALIEVDKDGKEKQIVHGAALKGTKLTQLENKLRDKLLSWTFSEEQSEDEIKDIITWITTKDNFDLDDVTKNVKAEKDMEEYSTSEKAVIKRLHTQGLEKGFVFNKGETLSFVKIKTRHKHDDPLKLLTSDILINPEEVYLEVDFQSYIDNEVLTMLTVFSLDHMLKINKPVGIWD